MQWRRSPTVFGVHIGAASQERIGNFKVTKLGSFMQRCGFPEVNSIYVSISGQKLLDNSLVTFRSSKIQRCSTLGLLGIYVVTGPKLLDNC
jgi:hypothetical protein